MRYALATPHVAATEAGAAAMAAGGTAIDGALAAAAVLAVAYPHMCALGGDAVALVRRPDGEVVVVNGTGAAPAAADAGAVAARHAGRMPATGPDTVTVPGVVAAWAAIAGLGARRGWAELLAPAARLASDGVAIAPGLGRAIADQAAQLLRDPGLAAIFLPRGRPLRAGGVLRQPALARTLDVLAAEGAGALYRGSLADSFAAGLSALGVPIDPDDLASHETELAPPLAGGFAGEEVLTSPPNTQGFVLLRMLDGLEPDAGDAELVRRFAAAAAERDATLGDPRAGAGDTVAVVAADEEGHAISLIQSVFASFGAGLLEPATGIVCHNRGAAFSLEPGPNRLAAGRRPAHTLMPVLTRRGGCLTGVHGTMGGQIQPLIHAQLLLRLAAGAAAQEAVAAPRAGPDGRRASGDAAGHAQVVRLRPGGGFDAGSDPRADGIAACGDAPAG
ncbi:MAG TPA: gamma-glutamyltransferase [Solirubrobacteraceae bacterium]|nr:gamma-glutamyltransferase [Solirubrobacteraceae bacterium]